MTVVSEKLVKLARMANQIADYFRAYPHEQAVAGVAEHIRSFWTRSMRRELAAYAEAGGDGVDPLVVEALSRDAAADKASEAAAG